MNGGTETKRGRVGTCVFLVLVLAVGAYFRTSGLFRDLDGELIVHPDEPKQILMLSHYLHGRYVQYHGSWFYDGYPYGLNRLDEGIIRLARRVVIPLRGLLYPSRLYPSGDPYQTGGVDPRVPGQNDLYRWARILRVLYGLGVIGLLYGAVRKLGGSRIQALCASGFYALAPLGSTVTHAATGDIGVDLFLAVALAAMAGYVRKGTTIMLITAGAACGMAFSSKYHGGLGLWLVGLPVLLSWSGARRDVPRILRQGGGAFLGFVAGVLVGTPAFFIRTSRTWKNMCINFRNVRYYCAPADYMERSPIQRIAYGVEHNLPSALSCLGWGLVLLSATALILVSVKYFRMRRTTAPFFSAEGWRRAHVRLGIVTFPWLALVLFTAFKPVLQPFHFSGLLPCMAVSVALLLQQSSAWSRRYRWMLGALVLVAGIESAVVSLREDFFWRRPGIQPDAGRFSREVFVRPQRFARRYRRRPALKRFVVESSCLSVFRNRPAELISPDPSVWSSPVHYPVPSVPLPGNPEWIVVDGPVFPRNDRMFFVPARMRPARISRTLVFTRPVEVLHLGLRTGRLPSRYHIRCPGQDRKGFLPPNSQLRVEIPVRKLRRSAHAARDGADAYVVPLRVSAELGPVWVALLDHETEQAVWETFGPEPPDVRSPAWPVISGADLMERLEALRYLDGEGLCLPAGTLTPLFEPGQALAAGAYHLTAEVRNEGISQSLQFGFFDLEGRFLPGLPSWETRVAPGVQTLEGSFEKHFIPYDASLGVIPEKEGLVIERWRLIPDATVLNAAGWERPAPPAHPPGAPSPVSVAVTFPGIGRWISIAVPGEGIPGAAFLYRADIELDPEISYSSFRDAVLFLHVKNAAGETVATLDVPLPLSGLGRDSVYWQAGHWPEDLPPGVYHLEGGLYNGRTHQRYAFHVEDQRANNPRRRYVHLADIIITPP